MKLCRIVFIFTAVMFSISVIRAEDTKKENSSEDSKKELSEIEQQVNELFSEIKEDGKNHKEIIKKVVKLGKPAIPFLKKRLYSVKVYALRVAVTSLQKIAGKDCLPDLIDAYVTQPDSKIISIIYYGIISYTNDALPYLQKVLESDDENKRFMVVRLIAGIDQNQTKDVLFKQFKNETSDLVKLQIIKFIYKFDNDSRETYLDFLHKSLESDNEDLKLFAIRITRFIKDDSKTELLISYTNDVSRIIRITAISTLVSFEREDSINAVLNCLKHEDRNTRLSAVTSLCIHNFKKKEYEKLVIDKIMAIFSAEDVKFRKLIVNSIKYLDKKVSWPQLKSIMENDPDPEVRKMAYNIYHKMKSKDKPTNPDGKVLPKDDEDDEDQKEITETEKKVNEILAKTNEKKFDEKELIRELAELGEPASEYIEKAMYADSKYIPAIAAEALLEIYDDKALSKIVKAFVKQALKKDIRYFREFVIEQKDKTLPFLRSELDTQEEKVRHEIILVAGLMETEKSVEMLAEWFKKEKVNKNKLYIIEKIYVKDANNQKEYLKYVHKMFDDEDIDTKCQAIDLSGEIKDTSKVDLLIKWTTHEEYKV